MSFDSLPIEVAQKCLARIPLEYHPTLALVSNSFRELIRSPGLFLYRSNQETLIYLPVSENQNENDGPTISWFNLGLKPRSLSLSTGYWLTKLRLEPHAFFPPSSHGMVSLKSKIFFLSRGFTSLVIFDCISHTWVESPPMNHPRMIGGDCHLCGSDDRVFVIGGCGNRTKLNVEYFTITDESWTPVPDPDHKNCEIVLVASPSGGDLTLWSRTPEEVTESFKHVFVAKSQTWDKFESALLPFYLEPFGERVHTLLVGDTIYRIFRSKLSWFNEVDKQWFHVEGAYTLRQQSLTALDKSGSLFVIGTDKKRKRVPEGVEEELSLWATQVLFKKLIKKDGSPSVTATQLWSDLVYRGQPLRLLGSTCLEM